LQAADQEADADEAATRARATWTHDQQVLRRIRPKEVRAVRRVFLSRRHWDLAWDKCQAGARPKPIPSAAWPRVTNKNTFIIEPGPPDQITRL